MVYEQHLNKFRNMLQRKRSQILDYRDDQEKSLRGKVAKGVKGVVDVNNHIEVVWSKDRSEQEIKAKVEDVLKWDAFVDHALIEVDIEEL